MVDMKPRQVVSASFAPREFTFGNEKRYLYNEPSTKYNQPLVTYNPTIRSFGRVSPRLIGTAEMKGR